MEVLCEPASPGALIYVGRNHEDREHGCRTAQRQFISELHLSEFTCKVFVRVADRAVADNQCKIRKVDGLVGRKFQLLPDFILKVFTGESVKAQ